MDIGEEEVVSMPISTTSFAAANDSSKLRMLASSAACPDDPDDVPPHGRRKDKRDRAAAAAAAAAAERDREQRVVRYRECLKNHAASMGGHVTDGCGEFMPAGDDGTPESLRCAACDCHRNFHRREVDGDDEVACDACFHRRASGIVAAAAPPAAAAAPPGSLIPAPALPFAARPPPVLPFRAAGDEHGEGMAGFPSLGGAGAGVGLGMGGILSSVGVKKRFRTKFTTEQKERMLAFAQRVGWRIQKHDETAVQHFCQEVGVKRHVLKVWMHNNKHAFTRPSAASSHSHSHFQQEHPPGSASDHHASAVAAAAAAALDSSNNNTNHINDHTGTTATNSSSNNDSTHSERDFQ